jgi:hypothetical protein
LSARRPVSYTIDGDGLRLDIALVEIGDLFLHEETISRSLDMLMADIERAGTLKSPVIVDRDSLVVLDGMHRVKALGRLGCRFICVCFVDYMNPEIRVDRWCRVASTPLAIEEFSSRFGELGEIVREWDSPEGGGASILLMVEEGYYEMAAHGEGVASAFTTVSSIDSWLEEKGLDVRYETEGDAAMMLERGEVGFVLCPPSIEKRHVLETIKSGRVFPPKATRHIVPARPFGVDVPLELLRDEKINVEEANRRLSGMLENRPLRRVPPGYMWGAHRYEEALFLFE